MRKPLPTLSEMPWHLKQNIFQYTNTTTKFALRQCCKEFKDLVDHKSQLTCNSLSLYWNCDEQCVEVERMLDGDCVETSFCGENDQNFMQSASEQFVKIFRTHPKMTVQHLFIQFNREYENATMYNFQKYFLLDCLDNALQSLNGEIAVKQFSIFADFEDTDILLLFLNLQPGTLERICLWHYRLSTMTCNTFRFNLRDLAETDQWKRAKYLYLKSFPLSLPFENTAHFNYIHSVAFRFSSLNFEDIVDKVLCTNGLWKWYSVALDFFDYSLIKRYTHGLEKVRTTRFHGDHFKIVRRGMEGMILVSTERSHSCDRITILNSSYYIWSQAKGFYFPRERLGDSNELKEISATMVSLGASSWANALY